MDEKEVAGARSGRRGVVRAELGDPEPLNEQEMAELQRRKRAAELESSGVGSGVGYREAEFEIESVEVHPRVELEVLREQARGAYEKEA